MALQRRSLVQSLWLATVLLAILGSSLVRANDKGKAAETEHDLFRVAGYLPDYRFYIDVNAMARDLTDLMLFSVAPKEPHRLEDLTTPFGCCLASEHYVAARKARAHHPKLRLWATIGGGGRSLDFYRQPGKLTKGIRALATEQKLDGVDLDCEHFASQKDYLKYMSWVNLSVPYWKEGGLNVSLALHAGQTMIADVYNAVDHINLMTYDLQGVGMYHADLGAVRKAVETLVRSGCPHGKVMLGIPAYARHRDNPGMVKSYAEIADEMEKEGIPTEHWDTIDNWKGFQFDSPRAVRRKVDLARSLKLAGVFFWELGQDKQHPHAPGGILLEAAAKGKIYAAPTKDEL